MMADVTNDELGQGPDQGNDPTPPKEKKTRFSGDHAHIKDANQRAYLRARAKVPTQGAACKIAKINRASVYKWKNEEGLAGDAFRAAEQDAKEAYIELMEEEADRRAMEGLRRLKFHEGLPLIDPATGEPYVEHAYSDTLLIFRLKAESPDKYRDQIGISGPTGGPVEVLHLDNLIEHELELAQAAARRKAEAAEPPAGEASAS